MGNNNKTKLKKLPNNSKWVISVFSNLKELSNSNLKIKKENIITKIAGMSYLQIFLLVLFTFSISYLIGIELKGVDAAGTGGVYCCDKTKTGAACQMVSAGDCVGNKWPTTCDQTTQCKPGCCYSEQTGICDLNTPKALCGNDKEFYDSASCNSGPVSGLCKKGCCIMGNSGIWTTEKNCQVESASKGFTNGVTYNFSTSIKSEIQCIFSVQKDNLGACVYDLDNVTGSQKGCLYTTLGECNTRLKIKDTVNPYFHQGEFCSIQNNTICKAKTSKGCQDAKEDVYWFDSCGNPEDVSQDCNFFTGSYCGKNPLDNTKYNCNDINCYIDGKKRLNGESWCEYDGTIGNGTDPAGSRHIKHICMMGEEKIEPCSDYRNEICTQKDTPTSDGSIFSQAVCKVNNWRNCFSYNNLAESELIKKCEAATDCFVNDVNIDENFHFKVCVAKYPPGFSFEEPSAKQVESGTKTQTQSQCSAASQTCTETWKWCLIGGWTCIDNCNCHEQVFTNRMNEFCHSLGDCGAWTNYNGVFTDGGYSLTSEKASPPRLDESEISKIKSYAKKNPKQAPAEPGDVTLETQNNDNLMTISGYDGILSGVPGSLGSPLLAKILSDRDNNITNAVLTTEPSSINYAQYATGTFASITRGIKEDNPSNPMMSAMIGAGIGFAIGFAIGFIAQLSTMWSMVLGAVFGLIIFLFMFCTIHKFKVDFQCNQWERPTGGNCNACNSIDVPCTKYRCESLGQTCNILNEGTTSQLCVDKCKGKQSIPQITSWDGVTGKLPTSGYIYKNIENGIEITKENGSCIDPYTQVDFGIKLVDSNDPNAICKYSQCKIGTDASKPYEDMDNFFGDDNSFLPYHKSSIFLPSPEALRFQYNISEEKMKELSTMNFYVKCKSATGQINPQPYKIQACVDLGPDKIAPVIMSIYPPTGSYTPYGKQSQDIQVFTNEPSNCRWSNVSIPYDQMENLMNCDTNLTARTNNGWQCTTTLTNLNESVFIRCRDISENNNTMNDVYTYNLIPSTSPLSIIDIKPVDATEIVSGSNPANVMLRLETSGGAEEGKSICQWNGNGFSDYFTETNASFHSYEWKLATGGSYNLNFYCEDAAGNNASATTSFDISIDDTGPMITRVYKNGGLKVFTDENAECRYGFDSNFDYDNSSIMSGNGLEHSAEWKPVMYYVQCKDIYKNPGGILQIKGYEL